MAKTGPARPGDRENDPAGDAGELDETIENLTIEVAKAAKINATPVVIGVVVILGLIMTPSILDKLKEREIQATNNEIDTALAGEPDEVRARIPGLLESLKGQAIETYTIERVARWYWDQGDEGSRQEAIDLLQLNQQRFPENYLINSYLQEFRTSQEASVGFVLPEPPAPEPVPEPVVVTPTIIEAPGKEVEVVEPTPAATQSKPQISDELPKPILSPGPAPTEKPAAKPEDLGPPPPSSGGDGN